MAQEIQGCAQQDNLLGFIYGELSEVEARAFQKHLAGCTACGAELADLNNVRRSVVTWRNESLAGVGFSTESAPAAKALMPQRSALAALREFFNLSPLWMKGAIGFAAVLFCVMAVIVVSRLQQNSIAPVAAIPATPAQTQEQLNALVQQRVQEELERRKQVENSKSQPEETIVRNANTEASRPFKKRESLAVNSLNQNARRPLSKIEREQLAMDLGLVSSNDSDLDLLEDNINQ
jgi:anti-sigma factor RsiW